MYKALICVGVSAMLLLNGCESSMQLSQAQLNAIETREVDASMNETYNAASGALFDAGYTIAMSDRQGGLLTGTKAHDRSAERLWVSPYIEDTKFAVSIQIRETAPKSCIVRIKTSINGSPKVDKEAIDQLWNLMQRQVLMKEPLSLETVAVGDDSSVANPSEKRTNNESEKANQKSPTNETSEKAPVENLGRYSGRKETCSNCGKTIPKLEQHFMLDKKIVCKECYAKKSPTEIVGQIPDTKSYNKQTQAEPNTPVNDNLQLVHCENCGRDIGKLETPYSYQGHIVCSECSERLKKP